MIAATVFSNSRQTSFVVIGELSEPQKRYYLSNGWTIGRATLNKNGIPIILATHRCKSASSVPVEQLSEDRSLFVSYQAQRHLLPQQLKQLFGTLQ